MRKFISTESHALIQRTRKEMEHLSLLRRLIVKSNLRDLRIANDRGRGYRMLGRLVDRLCEIAGWDHFLKCAHQVYGVGAWDYSDSEARADSNVASRG